MQNDSQAMTIFRGRAVRAIEEVALGAAVVGAAAVAVGAMLSGAALGAVAMPGVVTLVLLAVFFAVLARRWSVEWPVYAAEAASVGAYLLYRAAYPLPEALDAMILVLFCYLDFGLSQALERFGQHLYARPAFAFSLLLPLLPLGSAVLRGGWDDVGLLVLFATATFYGVVCHQKRWKAPGYAAAVLYNVFLWAAWARVGWGLADHPQFYLIPVGLSAILFAEVNRRELGRANVNTIRSLGSMVIYVSTAIPLWQFQSFGAWLTLLLLSLAGVFAGIGLRVQAFLWLGLVCFVFDLLYPLGRAGLEHVFARWAIMLGLGIALVLFVALNEKKRIVATLREYYEEVRRWE